MIVVDEIGSSEEVRAVKSIAQRGVMLVGTAHGVSLSSLISNPELNTLVGGVHQVVIGDKLARFVFTPASLLASPLSAEVQASYHVAVREKRFTSSVLFHFMHIPVLTLQASMVGGRNLIMMMCSSAVHSYPMLNQILGMAEFCWRPHVAACSVVNNNSKTKTERRGPPVFTCLVEVLAHDCWRVHPHVASSVDAMLAGRQPSTQLRMHKNDKLVVRFETVVADNSLCDSAVSNAQSSWLANLSSLAQSMHDAAA